MSGLHNLPDINLYTAISINKKQTLEDKDCVVIGHKRIMEDYDVTRVALFRRQRQSVGIMYLY